MSAFSIRVDAKSSSAAARNPNVTMVRRARFMLPQDLASRGTMNPQVSEPRPPNKQRQNRQPRMRLPAFDDDTPASTSAAR